MPTAHLDPTIGRPDFDDDQLAGLSRYAGLSRWDPQLLVEVEKFASSRSLGLYGLSKLGVYAKRLWMDPRYSIGSAITQPS